MPNPTWPPELPQFVEITGYDETLPFPVKRTQMQRGPAKQRRDGTSTPPPFNFTTDIMTAAQAAIFETFYFDTLKHGSLEWDWVHPRSQATKTFRFTAGPKPIPLGNGKVQYALALEAMP